MIFKFFNKNIGKKETVELRESFNKPEYIKPGENGILENF